MKICIHENAIHENAIHENAIYKNAQEPSESPRAFLCLIGV